MQNAKITSIVAAPLFGESPKGGWSAEIQPEDSIHALVAVHTDAGITGYGSVFTDGRLVQTAFKVLQPLFAGENALEPERVNEKLPQAVNLNAWPTTFFIGRDGKVHGTHVGFPSKGSGDFDKQARAQIDHEIETLLAEKS